jgi:hypothetical protein
MSESYQAVLWISATAKADTALMAASVGGVWHEAADIGVTAPYLLFLQQSGTDTDTANAHRLFSRLLFQIVAVGPTAQYATLATIADRIEALFGSTRSFGLPGGGGVLECWRIQPLAYPEPLVNGKAWSRLGGLYQIDVQGS